MRAEQFCGGGGLVDRHEPEDDRAVAQDDRVVAIGSTSWRNKLTGKVAATPKIDVWRMRDGEWFEGTYIFQAAKDRDEFRADHTTTDDLPSIVHSVTATARWSQDDRMGVEFAVPLRRDAEHL